MKHVRQKAMIVAAVVLLAMDLAYAIPAGSLAQPKAELGAIQELTKLKIPLQRDSRGVVRWIEATEGELSDEAMRYLPDLSKLEWLEIGGGAITPSGVAHLPRWH